MVRNGLTVQIPLTSCVAGPDEMRGKAGWHLTKRRHRLGYSSQTSALVAAMQDRSKVIKPCLQGSRSDHRLITHPRRCNCKALLRRRWPRTVRHHRPLDSTEPRCPSTPNIGLELLCLVRRQRFEFHTRLIYSHIRPSPRFPYSLLSLHFP